MRTAAAHIYGGGSNLSLMCIRLFRIILLRLFAFLLPDKLVELFDDGALVFQMLVYLPVSAEDFTADNEKQYGNKYRHHENKYLIVHDYIVLGLYKL